MHEVIRILEFSVAGAFVFLGVLGALMWLRRRDSQSAWMSLTFLILAVIASMAISQPEGFEPSAPPLVMKAMIGLLLLFPYFLYRFSTTFEAPSRALEMFAGALSAIAIVWPFLLPGFPLEEDPSSVSIEWRAYIFLVLAEWTALSLIMATRVWRGGRDLPKIARRRARLLSIAATLLSVVIVSSGAWETEGGGLELMENLLTLAAAVAFYFGFAPPAFMLTIWRKPIQDSLYRGMVDLVSAETEEEVSSWLLPHVTAMLGARAVALVEDDAIRNSHGATPEMLAEIPALLRDGNRTNGSNGILVIPLQFGSVVVWTSPYTPFFGEDELALVGTVATLAHFALERTRAARLREEEREKLELRVVQAQKMEAVGQLAGGIAHDFNNLLGIIYNFTTFVLDDLEESDERRADLEEVQKAASRGAALTRQLLAFSRKEVIKPEVIDIQEAVAGMRSMLRRTLSEAIELKVDQTADIWKTKIDRGELEQVILNMAINARDAMRDGGTLSIGASNVLVDRTAAEETPGLAMGAYICLTISDTGKGMTKEVAARIFDPFFTTKERGAGTGLGMATVYGIVKRAGGYISIYSEPDVGTTFRVYLPASDEETIDLEERAPSRPPRAAGQSVLVAEDEESIRKLIERILTRHGYRVESAASGGQALELLERATGDFDILLTDVVMPGVSGKELASKVTERSPATKVLFMSGYPNDIIAHHGVLQEGENYLQKPFSSEQLLNEVARVADQGVRSR